ncbi:hypothetical protein HanIR_Chr12g0604721 [Helianthus annuus]|nr:hypothetical protein HanIR_Chr12g0604721 [Helianthus annuus]
MLVFFFIKTFSKLHCPISPKIHLLSPFFLLAHGSTHTHIHIHFHFISSQSKLTRRCMEAI